MKIIIRSLLFALLMFGITPCNNYADDKPKELPISEDRWKKHITILGSDLFEGRGTGQPGAELAAKYLALEFEKIGLLPIGQDGSYYQHIPMHGSKTLPSSELQISINGNNSTLKVGPDYLMNKSGDQTFIPNPLEMVFVGYGIIAPEYDYNDYLSVDVEGKIVVMLEGEPLSDDPAYFEAEKQTIYEYPDSKERTAFSRGASGCVFIPNVAQSGVLNWSNLQMSFNFEKITLAYTVASKLSLVMNPSKAVDLFTNAKFSLKDIWDMHTNKQMESFDLKSKLAFRGKFRNRDFMSQNVIGMIPGNDTKLKDSYIIISAHYDHLGVGPAINKDSIYNGVADNAMGAAALLELAEVFSKPEFKPDRTIVFLLTTGEEKGLIGSHYYCDHPSFPLYKTIANINIDGLSFFDRTKSFIGVGTELSSLSAFFERAVKKINCSVTTIPQNFIGSESFNYSDQLSFAMAGIPSIMIYEGPDFENYSREQALEMLINFNTAVYHTVFDDMTLPINSAAALQHMTLLYHMIEDLSRTDTVPKWNPGVPFIDARLKSAAIKK